MNHPNTAKEIMSTRLVSLSPDTNVFSGIAQLLKYNITGASVLDSEQRFLGVFSEKCCMSVLAQTSRLVAENEQKRVQQILAKDFMARRLVTLSPEMDVFEAIGLLLKNHISGAPVVDHAQNFVGVFSEKFSMHVVINSAYNQLPTTQVHTFMNTDTGRIITEETDLLSVAQIFLTTPYRRLTVLRGKKLVGQISRRDVLTAEHHLSTVVRFREKALMDQSTRIDYDIEFPCDRLSDEVGSFMDITARTITENMDLLTIAQIFLNTNYRRLPVLRDGVLVGQISRRQILQAAYQQMELPPNRKNSPLYLSAISESNDTPME